MRYWLYYRAGDYYIITAKNYGIIAQAIALGASPVASFYTSSPEVAAKALVAAALSHYFKLQRYPGK